MNQDRRASIEKQVNEVRDLANALRNAYDELTTLQEEEQEAFDNLPEGLQQADRGQSIEAISQALEDGLSNLDSAIGDIESSADDIESALEN